MTVTHDNMSNHNHIYKRYTLQGSGSPTIAPGSFHRTSATNGLSLRAGKTNPAVVWLWRNAADTAASEKRWKTE